MLATNHSFWFIDILRNTFSTDPNFLGSYSYQIAGINEDDYRGMEHPFRQSLYFAGEAYQRWEYGYSHGAYQNGNKAAQNITKCLRNSDNCPTDSPVFIMEKDCTTSAGFTMRENLLAIVLMNIVLFSYLL